MVGMIVTFGAVWLALEWAGWVDPSIRFRALAPIIRELTPMVKTASEAITNFVTTTIVSPPWLAWLTLGIVNVLLVVCALGAIIRDSRLARKPRVGRIVENDDSNTRSFW